MIRKSKSPVKDTKKSVSPVSNSRSTKRQRSLNSQQSDERPQRLLQIMKRNRDKLCQSMDTYTLLIQTQCPLRCLQHNSAISLYCQTEQKLMCANCVYGNINHRLHKVLPVQKATSNIQSDIIQMKKQASKQIKAIQSAQALLYSSLEYEEAQLQNCLRIITDMYSEVRQKLAEAEDKSKKELIMFVQNMRLKHQTVLLELGFLKKLYSESQFVQFSKNKDEQLMIYQHLMLSALKSQGKFDGTKWNTTRNQVKNLADKQFRNVQETKRYIVKRLIEFKSEEVPQHK